MAEPSVLILSVRAVRHRLFNSALYEFEDLVVQLCGATLFAPKIYHGHRGFTLARASRRAADALHAPSRLPRWPYPTERRLDRHYDVLLVVVDNPYDICLLHLIEGVDRYVERVVCVIPELWLPQFEGAALGREELDLVDRYYLGTEGTIDALRDLSGRPVAAFAPAVDALRFSAHLDRPRVARVTNIGRRSEVTHAALLADSEAKGWFYLYDDIADGDFPEARSHRDWLCAVLNRSRFVVANFARCDSPELHRGQHEVGYRLPESTAAGAVLIGTPPNTEMYSDHFGWQDATIELPIDAPAAASMLDELEQDPERLHAIGIRNAANTLALNDWAHRWDAICADLGLARTAALTDRLHQLEERSAQLMALTV